MLSSSTAVIPYSTATKLASVYAASVAKILELSMELGGELKKLNETFSMEADSYGAFNVEMSYQHSQSNRVEFNEKGMKKLEAHFRRAAWKVLVSKLEIEKLMCPSERDKLHSQLNGERMPDGSPAVELPEITESSIIDVLMGFLADAPRFIEQSIREVYDWMIPRSERGAGQYKTNKRDRIGKRVVLKYIADNWALKHGGSLSVSYNAFGKLTALDSIFHSLDGKGIASGHNGPLLDTMRATAADGTGETDYFSWKLCKNGNCHMEFKRQDLLDLFNQVASDGKSLGEVKAKKAA